MLFFLRSGYARVVDVDIFEKIEMAIDFKQVSDGIHAYGVTKHFVISCLNKSNRKISPIVLYLIQMYMYVLCT